MRQATLCVDDRDEISQRPIFRIFTPHHRFAVSQTTTYPPVLQALQLIILRSAYVMHFGNILDVGAVD